MILASGGICSPPDAHSFLRHPSQSGGGLRWSVLERLIIALPNQLRDNVHTSARVPEHLTAVGLPHAYVIGSEILGVPAGALRALRYGELSTAGALQIAEDDIYVFAPGSQSRTGDRHAFSAAACGPKWQSALTNVGRAPLCYLAMTTVDEDCDIGDHKNDGTSGPRHTR